MSMSHFTVSWRCNMVGPPWFRRLRTAWGWYRSREPMITTRDMRQVCNRAEGMERALRDLERGCRKAGLRYGFIYDTIQRGLGHP